MALTDLCERQREIANALFSEQGECACSWAGSNDGKGSCLTREEDRPLTKAEKAQGLSHRPFFAYDDSKMCAACAAYFHAERAAQILHRMHSFAVRCAARNPADAAETKGQ